MQFLQPAPLASKALQSGDNPSQLPVETPQDEVTRKIKIIVCGDTGSGRAALLQRFIEDKFEPNSVNRHHWIEKQDDWLQKEVTINNKKVTICVCLNSDEKSPSGNQFKSADGVLFVYDPTDKVSFNNVKQWNQLVDRNNQNCHKILVSTKNDLNNIAIDANAAKECAEQLNCDNFIETSAKTGSNVQAVFETIASNIINNVQKAPLVEKTLQQNSARKSVWRWEQSQSWCCPALHALAGLITLVAAGVFFTSGAGTVLGVGLLLTSIGAFSLMFREFKSLPSANRVN